MRSESPGRTSALQTRINIKYQESIFEMAHLIIVGGGTAGCVLANRLSEDPNVSVLVLEAGEDRSDDDRVYTPGLAGSVLDDPKFDWQYVSEPSPSMSNRRMKHPRGRRNKLTGDHIYPSAADIDVWAELGNDGWDWKTLAPYFLKFQTIEPPNDEVKKQVDIIHSDETIRKSNGPVRTSFPSQVTKLHKIWLDTFRSLDLENVSDPLTGHAIGGHTSTCHITGDRCERSHARVAYLDPVLERKNLTTIRNAMVHRLAIGKDSSGPIVRGVWYSQHGILHKVAAKREVILAAGTFNTPQILELSGIGDPIILEQHGIDVVYANPAVVHNLQDHIRAWVSFEVNDDAPVPRPTPIDKARRMYEGNRSGPLTQNGAFMFSYTPLAPFLDPEGHDKLKSMLDRHLEDDGSCSPFLLWMSGPTWPIGGELDILEGVNTNPRNKITGYTNATGSCTNSQVIISSNLTSTDCTDLEDTGCSMSSSSTASYGTGFNTNSGGVYATEWTEQTGIRVWFFPRSSIPSDIISGKPEPNTWGIPAAAIPAESCDM
ncbi:alcohol oxidase, partial [Aureobasidium pullulans]